MARVFDKFRWFPGVRCRKGVGSFVAGLFLSAVGLLSDSHAEHLSLAFPEFSKELNFLSDNEPVARFIRSAVGATLVTRTQSQAAGGGLSYRLALADGVSMSADHKEWKFRIRPHATFSNGASVQAHDVVFSLTRCLAAGTLPSSIEGITPSVERSSLGMEAHFVVLTLTESAEGEPFPLPLADCPIIERQSGLVFDKFLGVGVNGVYAGLFELTGLELGRQYVLSRARGQQPYAETLTIRGMRDPRHALTALRTGTVDAFFTSNEDVLALARKDATLELSECFGQKVVKRRGLNLECGDSIDVQSLRYVS